MWYKKCNKYSYRIVPRIYDKKVFQLLNIKSQNNRKRPMRRCIYCINVQVIRSIWIVSFHYRWRNVGRDEKYTDTIAVLWFQKSVFQGMTKAACADPVSSVVTAWCPAPHLLLLHVAWPSDSSASGSPCFSLVNTFCTVFSLINRGAELRWVVFLQRSFLYPAQRRSGAALPVYTQRNPQVWGWAWGTQL